MINIGVIGCGQWGPNHIRNFSSMEEVRVLMCADLNRDRLKAMKQQFRTIHPTNRFQEILNHPRIQAVVVATPTATHFNLVKAALMANKDVLCEKPLCLDERQAKELIRLAQKKKRILMVGHVFLYNAGIQKLKELIQKKSFGRIYYLHSERTNLGPFRQDVNAVWDLAAHDVSIFNYLLNAEPIEVSARGGIYLQKKIEDVAFISLVYPKNILVSIHVSWLDPRKVRQITVVGDKHMLMWDDLDQTGPVKIYDRQVVQKYYYETFGEFQLLAKEGTITIPKVNLSEPLKAQANAFIAAVRKRKSPLSDGRSGLSVVRILKAVQKSLAKRGVPVRLQ
ncbi:MAG: oxidoreductase [Candidatus Omnitrophica bacterium CG11_big_fil_rev_8_21_14_0_20_45_26]|uniref:Oxidoreductase n=1 Tax=Candidatus Abzuiibacterium crystallinum TaxID=1974748 RepID=A0A2H0LQW4_9BACT|nr:MAG: oxidoreductase [Candidatus Omnitrophica bacterium CG11_big_fil_rev_8_21_14_0_20_45_26]PIW64650.1 MAG: gfo/Idh/MocA family oxidoreductase [Candidatus Omnitrophica bacterium CG12_big_fil_rev_8_21_14_0_65_45_16]